MSTDETVVTETEEISDEKNADNLSESDEPEKEVLQQMEQLEEAKLKSKYPSAIRPGAPAFLQKRLNKGQKYFDSGDYNMAKAKGQKRTLPAVVPQTTTGDAIPTPDNLPTRKTSLVQSKLAAGLS